MDVAEDYFPLENDEMHFRQKLENEIFLFYPLFRSNVNN